MLDLAEQDEGAYATRTQIEEQVLKYGLGFWVSEIRGVRFGVGICLKVKGFFIMEGLKDKRVFGATIKHSVEAGRLILDRIFVVSDVIHTCAREKDKGIQILCKKLGFKKTGVADSGYGPIVWFQKEKKKCPSYQ
jgi:hypothetical protein